MDLEISTWLEERLKSWVGEYAEILEPVDWFVCNNDLDQDPGAKETNVEGRYMPYYYSGKMIWIPAPADTITAIVELLKASQKRQKSIDMFIVSRLMSPLWWKQLLKSADIVLELKPGHSYFTLEMLEPPTSAVYYPYLSHIP